jgi:lipoprotein-anchoring transpeptidase ErfK/SrfK
MLSSAGAALIVINLSSNSLSFFEDDVFIRSWNVGTGRAGHSTPTGWFKVVEKETCPPYFGAAGQPTFIAGCSQGNPFGEKILWFIGHTYGIHGTHQPWLIDVTTTSDERRISGGCVRSRNTDIEWLYHRVQVGTPIYIHW